MWEKFALILIMILQNNVKLIEDSQLRKLYLTHFRHYYQKELNTSIRAHLFLENRMLDKTMTIDLLSVTLYYVLLISVLHPVHSDSFWQMMYQRSPDWAGHSDSPILLKFLNCKLNKITIILRTALNILFWQLRGE